MRSTMSATNSLITRAKPAREFPIGVAMSEIDSVGDVAERGGGKLAPVWNIGTPQRSSIISTLRAID